MTKLGPGSAHVVGMFGTGLLTYVVILVVARLLGTIAKLPVLGIGNALGGALIGFAKGAILLWLVLFIALFFPLSPRHPRRPASFAPGALPRRLRRAAGRRDAFGDSVVRAPVRRCRSSSDTTCNALETAPPRSPSKASALGKHRLADDVSHRAEAHDLSRKLGLTAGEHDTVLLAQLLQQRRGIDAGRRIGRDDGVRVRARLREEREAQTFAARRARAAQIAACRSKAACIPPA